jgi:hypothetical protein
MVTEPAVDGAVNKPEDELIVPPPLTIEYVYGVNPPLEEKVKVLLTAKVLDVGEIVGAFTIVTEAFEVFDKESVTRTVTEPAVDGAVNKPVEASIMPPPLVMV